MTNQATIPYGINNPSDLMNKLRRDSEKLDAEATPDNIFNFFITAYHLLDDWIRRSPNPNIPQNAKKCINEKQGNKNDDNVFNICRDIALGSKHFIFDKKTEKKKIIINVKVINAGWGEGRWGKMPWGGSEPIVDFKTNGTVYNIHDLRKEIMDFCEYLFDKYKIP